MDPGIPVPIKVASLPHINWEHYTSMDPSHFLEQTHQPGVTTRRKVGNTEPGMHVI